MVRGRWRIRTIQSMQTEVEFQGEGPEIMGADNAHTSKGIGGAQDGGRWYRRG